MSSLIFKTEERQVFVATDTLAVAPGGRALMFTTKALIVPHLRMLMAGTGTGGFLDRWFVNVNSGKVVIGIENLDYHTPKSLSDLWQKFKEEKDEFPEDQTTTVYHFGFSEETGVIRAFAYRSTNGFVSEPLGYGIAMKPECSIPQNLQLPGDIKSMMDEQREIQRALPENQRVYIGGEIQIHHLMEAGFNVYTLDRFDDFAADAVTMFNAFRK
jgi:hypothetical protein